jgi:hypothetical protein
VNPRLRPRAYLGLVNPDRRAALVTANPSAPIRRARGAPPRRGCWCTASDGGSTGPTSAAATTEAGSVPAAPKAIPLEVFVYNVEYGGDESTDAVIRGVDADIVGVLESYNRLPEIAPSTGYPFYNVSLQLLSKYPIHEPSGAEGRYALIVVRPGQVVAFSTSISTT